MTNNDVLRRIRYMFDYGDSKMMGIFKSVDFDVERATLCDWLKKEDDPLQKKMTDNELAIFLNGLIVEKRGKKEGPQPEAEAHLNNNIILRKLKIAFDLKADDTLELFASKDIIISKHELSAFFRKPDHKSYRPCLDQYLRSFMNALQTKYKE